MLRTIGAVIAGYVAIGILVVITDQIFAMSDPGFKAAAMPPLYYFVISLATDTAYTVAGGALCALLARERSRSAALGLIALGEAIGLASTVMLWASVPHWYSFALLAIYPPAVWLGSRLPAWARLVSSGPAFG